MRSAAVWSVTAAVLNFGWELLQLPLYTLYYEADRASVAYMIAHCTAGDVLISLAGYSVSSVALRDWRWPLGRLAAGSGMVVAACMAYTAFSEWLNVSVRGTWTYAAAMPTVAGIGLSPLVQWLVLPPVVAFVTRLTLQRWESSESRS